MSSIGSSMARRMYSLKDHMVKFLNLKLKQYAIRKWEMVAIGTAGSRTSETWQHAKCCCLVLDDVPAFSPPIHQCSRWAPSSLPHFLLVSVSVSLFLFQSRKWKEEEQGRQAGRPRWATSYTNLLPEVTASDGLMDRPALAMGSP